MWRQDEEREVSRCGSPSLPSSRITGVPSALSASSMSSSERCITITTLGQERQTSCVPPVKSNEEVHWRLSNCKNSNYFTEALSADQPTANTSPKTVGLNLKQRSSMIPKLQNNITVTLPCFLHSLTVLDHEITVSSRKRREMTPPACVFIGLGSRSCRKRDGLF